MNIRALVSELSDGEMEAFQQMADEEGFDMKEGEEEAQSMPVSPQFRSMLCLLQKFLDRQYIFL